MRKRLVTILLSMAMVVSSFPITAFAEENFEEIEIISEEDVTERISENEIILGEEQQEETSIDENIIEEMPVSYEVEETFIEDEAFVEEDAIEEESVVVEEVPLASTSTVPTEQEAYQRMIAMKAKYPEGTTWTNANGYAWKGGIYSQGGGCVGFAFLLSDAAFGDLPARKITEFTFDDVHVGDILRLYSDTHTVIVLEKHTDYVIIAEGNYAGTVHWGRQFTKRGVELCRYMLTRYPEVAVETPAEEPKAVVITEQPQGCTAAVGATASFKVVASNVAKYQWQYSKNDGANWYNSSVSGSETDCISFKATTSNRTMLYRCKLTGKDGTITYSDAVGFKDSLTINTQPADVTAAIGTKVTFSFSASNAASYQWQYSKDGKSWYKSTAEGNTTDTLQLTASTTTKSNIYRCKVVGTDGSVQYTNSVTVR